MELKTSPQRLFADCAQTTGRRNYLELRQSPSSAIVLAACGKRAGGELVGDPRELYLVDEHRGGKTAYARLPGDTLAGEGALFTREDAVEAAWAVVAPVLMACPGYFLTCEAVGGQKSLTQSSLTTAVETTSGPRKIPDYEPAAGAFSPDLSRVGVEGKERTGKEVERKRALSDDFLAR